MGDFISKHFGDLAVGSMDVAGFTGTGASIGAVAGSVIPGVGTLFGAGIGAMVGLLGGSIYTAVKTTKSIQSPDHKEPTVLDYGISAAGMVGGVAEGAGGLAAKGIYQTANGIKMYLQGVKIANNFIDSHYTGYMNKQAPALGIHPKTASILGDSATRALVGKTNGRLNAAFDRIVRPIALAHAVKYAVVASGSYASEGSTSGTYGGGEYSGGFVV